MKIVGYLISLGGLIALVYAAITYVNNTKTFGLLGLDIATKR